LYVQQKKKIKERKSAAAAEEKRDGDLKASTHTITHAGSNI
jgi:hypothetical protein